MGKKVLNVLYQTDDNYAIITGVSMISLFEKNIHIDDINIFLLDAGIEQQNIEKIKKICNAYKRNLEIISTKEFYEQLDKLGVEKFRNSYIVYYRILAYNSLKIITDRLISIDSDTIINGPLDEICDIDLKGYVLAGTYDCGLNDYKEIIGLKKSDKYYNAGVLILNQKEWIENNCQEKFLNHIKNVRSKYYLCEQDIMNIIFRDKIKYLDIKFNLNCGLYIFGVKQSYKLYNLNDDFYTPVKEIKEAMKHPIIYHCMGDLTGRPWEVKNSHPQKDLFYKYIKISPWNDFVPKTKRTNIAKVQQFLYKILPEKIYIPIHRYAKKRTLIKMNGRTL